MKTSAPESNGIDIDVDELVGIRGDLSGLRLADVFRRASNDAGARKTRVTGRGMEYEESRVYVSGDDVRTMDWRVLARTGVPHTKIFAEEKERRFLLGVDLSRSMFFGTRYSFKSWAAAQTAAYLGWLASFDGDRIGGLVVAPGFHEEVRPGKARSGLLAVFHQLAAAGISATQNQLPGNRFNFLLRELMRVVKPGSIISIISDFIGLDDESLELIANLERHNDIYAFWVHDETETKPWPVGYYQVLMAGQSTGLQLGEASPDGWLAGLQKEHRLQIQSLTLRYNIPVLPVSCNRDIGLQILPNPFSR